MERRDFLKKTGQAAMLAAVTGSTAWLFHNRATATYRPVVSAGAGFGVNADPTLPKVTLARRDDPRLALAASLDALGGIKRFVKPGERVLVKPNVGWDRTPEQAANTNPELVGEMVRLCLEAGAKEVVVADITCNDPRRCFLRSGIREASEKAGGRVILPGDEDYVEVDLGGKVLTRWPVAKCFIETDRFINMPIVKQHSLSLITVGMKNLYGIIGGRRNQLHQQIDQSIVDLVAFSKPTLTVVDATRVLLRGGPTGGSLDDVAIENSVICATDPVAADARAAEFLGLTGDLVPHIVLAAQSGLGTLDYKAAGYLEVA
jgi:uncharacterized protein (DUF362 family)